MRPTTAERRTETFEQALRVLVRDFPERTPSVDELASEVLTSPRQLQRAFNDAGTTLREATLAVRMAYARDLLRDPDRPLSEVAERVGYAHRSHFAKAFRRRFGVPPGAWRAGDAERRGPGRPWQAARAGAPGEGAAAARAGAAAAA
jgi:AraC-like DNA-binding protein